jgi:hypothetical protein
MRSLAEKRLTRGFRFRPGNRAVRKHGNGARRAAAILALGRMQRVAAHESKRHALQLGLAGDDGEVSAFPADKDAS